MKQRALPMLLALTTVFCASPPAVAAEAPASVEVRVNHELVDFTGEAYEGVSYLPFYAGVAALRPDALITWENGAFYAQAEDFTMSARAGDRYLVINERYFYVPMGVKSQPDGAALVPARTLATALGAWIDWFGWVDLHGGGTPLSAEDRPYDDATVDLLARVITHEAGNQSLEGKMAVGNVILNRVNSASFPNTVSEVVYQKGQFPGATNAKPNAQSIVAAKLVLEGANVVPGAYYFNGAGISCWASRNKKHITTIGGHAFYG